jgi:hypothetical protein
MLNWKRVERGKQVSDDGRYAVESDGYEPGQHIGAEHSTGYEGFTGGEWAAVVVATNENLDWFATIREAKACCERHAARA